MVILVDDWLLERRKQPIRSPNEIILCEQTFDGRIAGERTTHAEDEVIGLSGCRMLGMPYDIEIMLEIENERKQHVATAGGAP